MGAAANTDGASPSTVIWWAQRRPLATLDLSGLSGQEHDRLARHRTEPGRERSALARVVLRFALGEVLGRPVTPIDWSGGPSVPGGQGPWLSIAHSADRVAVAISRAGPVGVDIEARARADTLRAGLEARVCAPSELAALRRLPGEARAAELLRLWTIKEAILKSTGDGLAVAPGDVEVEVAAATTTLRAYRGRPELVGQCSIAPLTGDPGYVGTVVVLTDDLDRVEERWFEARLDA